MYVTLAATGLALIFWVAGAFADAGNPILGTIRATAVDNGNGTVTVFVRGQWWWDSHNKDCNIDRAGAGVGIIWNDPTEPGYPVPSKNPVAQVGIASLRPGDTVNQIDEMVHPSDVGNLAEGYPGFVGQVFNDPNPPDPDSYLLWKGGCGREPITATASPGPLPALEPSGKVCAGAVSANDPHPEGDCFGDPWGSWGYSKNGGEGYSHTYLKTALPDKVCVNFYDVHGGGNTPAKLQLVNGANEITVDANKDNSIQTNAFNVNLGANCVSVVVSSLTTSATDTQIGGSISDTATLSGVPADAGGTITFKAFGPGDSTCSNAPAFTSAAIAVHGPGDYNSGPFTPQAVGTYYWEAHYTGGGLVLGADSACGAATVKETSVVSPFQPTLTTNAGPTVALVNGSASLTDTATLSGGSSDIGGTITFKLFSDDTCTTQVGTDQTVNVDGNSPPDYTSGAIVVHTAGTYHWIANYNGDPKNTKTANECNEANENVRVVNPGILIAKTPDEQVVRTGSTVTFHIKVQNTGDSTLTDVTVTDAQAPGCARTKADVAGLASMAPGAVVEYDCTVSSVNASFTNSATACGTTDAEQQLCDTDTAHVTVIHPAIDIVKDPDNQTILKGTPATFTITVKNTGDSPLTGVHVTDAEAPGCARTAAEITAARGGNTVFAPNDTFSYQCESANRDASFTNSATATGHPQAGPDVEDTDTADVTVINPSIDVAKDPNSQTIVSGTTATFTIKVTNTGDVALTNVHVTDAQAPDCARADLGTLAAGASTSYQCTLADVTEDFTNTATAIGTPPVGPDVTKSDSADVDVINPKIKIDKGPDGQSVTSGGTVTFMVTVTNTGDVDLTNVTVTDPLTGSCANTIGNLAAGASTSYSCTTGALSESFTNVATVTGHPPAGPDVTDSDNAPVTVTQPATPPPPATHPAIAVTKLPGTQTVTTGQTASFTITVTNTGDVTLTDVNITDALSPGCARTKADVAGLASMAPGAVVTYQCTSAAVTASFTNVAIATGTPPSGPTVTASASAAVTAQAPATPPKPVVKPKVKPKVVSHKKPKATG